MPPSKKRKPSFRAVAAGMMTLCLAIAAFRLALGLAPALDPSLSSAEISCTFWTCELDRDPRRLLAELGGPPLINTAPERVRDIIAEPAARALIGAAGLVRALPWAAMFLFLGLAFRSVRQRRTFAEAAARLRTAALAALAAAVLEPVAATMRATALSPILLGERQFFFLFDASDVVWGVMVAGTAFVVVWVLERAQTTERELAKIV